MIFKFVAYFRTVPVPIKICISCKYTLAYCFIVKLVDLFADGLKQCLQLNPLHATTFRYNCQPYVIFITDCCKHHSCNAKETSNTKIYSDAILAHEFDGSAGSREIRKRRRNKSVCGQIPRNGRIG